MGQLDFLRRYLQGCEGGFFVVVFELGGAFAREVTGVGMVGSKSRLHAAL